MAGLDRCCFGDKFKCTTCDFVVYQNCPKYTKARAAALAGCLAPFKMVRGLNTTEPVVHGLLSVSDAVKSECAIYAIQRGFKVKILSISLVMDIAFGREEFPEDRAIVFYIDGSFQGQSSDSILLGLNCFLDTCLYNHIRAFVTYEFAYKLVNRPGWCEIVKSTSDPCGFAKKYADGLKSYQYAPRVLVNKAGVSKNFVASDEAAYSKSIKVTKSDAAKGRKKSLMDMNK